jgi:hypothetical protein
MIYSDPKTFMGMIRMKFVTLIYAGLIATAATVGSAEERLLVMDNGVVRLQSSSSLKGATPGAHQKTLQGSITWNVVYLDVLYNSNRGFDDPATGAAARAILEQVLLDMNAYLVGTATVDVEVSVSTLSGTFFCSGGSFYDSLNGVSDPDSMKVITTGINNYPTYPDVVLQLNASQNYNFTLGAPAANQHDLYSRIMGGVIRSLGVVTLTDANGNSTDINNYDTISRWDSFLENGAGTRLWGSGGQFNGTPSWLTGGSGGVWFDGSNGTSQYGNRIPVFAPPSFITGVSLTNLDGAQVGVCLLASEVPIGTMMRTPKNWELGILQDLGYTVNYGAAVEEWVIF